MTKTSPIPGIEALHFLVVEDHGFQRWALGNILADLGARQVLAAPDGRAALDIIEGLEEPLDIIVSDLDMPGMDGMELLRHVGERKIPVSIILASGLDRSLIASVESMARAYGVDLLGALQKPTTPANLDAAIRRYRRREAAAPARREAHRFTLDEICRGLRNDEFEPFFQPKVALADAQVAGAEALARWRHPAKGVLPTGAFIESLTDAEIDEKLALAMVRKSARACRAWQMRGLPGTVSVRLSPATLAATGLAERLFEAVLGEGLAPRQLTFEVTESASAAAPALENLSRLRLRGFGLSIDDYGIGCSSMEHVSRIAFTQLRIDRAFVKGALTNASSKARLASTLEMARRLRVVCVAEGVRRQAEWELLRELGCDHAQGFLVAQPLDGAAYLDWLRQARRSP